MPDVSLVFTNSVAPPVILEPCVNDLEDVEDSGPEFEVNDQNFSVADTNEEVFCSTALHII